MNRFFLTLIALFSVSFTGCLNRQSEEAAANLPAAPPSSYPDGQGEAPVAAPATPSGVQTTYSGLQYEVLKQGSGRKPTMYNSVKVHYHGYLLSGKVFDSSVERGRPSTFGLNQVIPGWTEGIQLMREGAKYRFTIPPHLAYGERGSPPAIGPNQTLKFDVELLEVLY